MLPPKDKRSDTALPKLTLKSKSLALKVAPLRTPSTSAYLNFP